MGREAKPFKYKGKTYDGLYRRLKTNIWKITAAKPPIYFRCDNELAAIARFLKWKAAQKQKTLVEVKADAIEVRSAVAVKADEIDAFAKHVEELKRSGQLTKEKGLELLQQLCTLGSELHNAEGDIAGVPREVLAAIFREWLLKEPKELAALCGMPGLANVQNLVLAPESIKLSTLIEAYEKHAQVEPITRRKVRAAWDEFVKVVEASNLDGLSTAAFNKYGDWVKSQNWAKDTVKSYFQKIKTVISFGLTRGMDAVQIRGALDRAKVLQNPRQSTDYKPEPISRKHFTALLEAADPREKAALLLSLNCCLYISEVLAVDWNDLDLRRKVFLSSRNKTGIVRCAVLWNRTVKALKDIMPHPAVGAVFKSSRGDRYHPNSYRKVFAALRIKAKLSAAGVEFNQLRDGAYTAACSAGVEFHLAQILAGHKQHGQADHYIARNPQMVAPACMAVERSYFG